MGERIIQPPFYNSGFYNIGAGGGGGVKSWLHNTFISARGVPKVNSNLINGYGSSLCGIYPEIIINTNDYSNGELSLHYKLDETQTSPGQEIEVLNFVGYDNLWNGTRGPIFFTHNCSTKIFKIYSYNTSKNQYILYTGNSGQAENIFKAKFDFTNLSVNLQMNGVELGEFNILVRPVKWTPSILMTLNSSKNLNMAYLNSKGALYLENTYLKLDDDMIFGYDE